MARIPPLALTALALALSTTGRAETPPAAEVAAPFVAPDGTAAADGYCEATTGEADAASQLLLWPELFGQAGLVNAGSAVTGDPSLALGTTVRTTAGLRYNFVGIYHGLLMRWQADAACRRYRALSTLKAALQVGKDVGEREAATARIEVLTAAVEEAEARLAEKRTRFEAGRVTLDEVVSHELKVEGLRASLDAARAEKGAAEAGPDIAAGLRAKSGLLGVLAEYDRASDDEQEHASSLRSVRAWDVSVRGGLDYLFGANQRIPAFGLVSVSYNIGGLFQGGGNERAEDGAQKLRDTDVTGVRVQVRRLLHESKRALATTRGRLARVDALGRDVEKRLADLRDLEGERAKQYASYLWFDAVRLRADAAGLRARAAALAGFVGTDVTLPPARGPLKLRKTAAVSPALHGSIGESASRAVAVPRLDVTRGTIVSRDATTFVIEDPKVRAVLKGDRSRDVIFRFTWRGETDAKTALKGGDVRAQLGLKLRAQDGCNVLYAMWRTRERALVVQVKENPNAHTHIACGNAGYRTVTPRATGALPVLEPGDAHTLRATLDGPRLTVRVDDTPVWEGVVGELSFDGPVGVRTDNVRIEGNLLLP